MNLRASYGTVVLQKGLRLYHVSNTSICKLPGTPVLCMTLHPSEWYVEGVHISVIELQRDVTLLFMVKLIHNMKLYSSLHDILQWIPHLQHESLDGWVSSIQNNTALRFAVLNDSALQWVECSPIRFNWTHSTYKSGSIVPKQWGTIYPIHTRALPARMNLPSRFRNQIERYIQIVQEEDPLGTAFSVLLDNAIVSFFDELNEPM